MFPNSDIPDLSVRAELYTRRPRGVIYVASVLMQPIYKVRHYYSPVVVGRS